MILSDARLAANRRNATRSTGPKTDEGKAASRRNALKHGLTGSTVDLDDARAIADRAEAVTAEVRPRWSWQTWVCGELAGITRRLDRLRIEEAKLRDLIAYRATTTWDADRQLAAAHLGARLAIDPERVVLQLRATPQGCDWLTERWVALASLAEQAASGSGTSWTPEQRRLASDLLGKPRDVALERLGLALDGQGRPMGAIRSDGEVARRALADLARQRAEVVEGDFVARSLAENGFTADSSVDLRRLRRYEADLNRRLVWCVAQLDRPGAESPPESPPLARAPRPPRQDPPPSPPMLVPLRSATPAPVAPPTEHPFPPIRRRVEVRLQQAEARRDRKRSKLDRRRD